jgi:hypothetical protein
MRNPHTQVRQPPLARLGSRADAAEKWLYRSRQCISRRLDVATVDGNVLISCLIPRGSQFWLRIRFWQSRKAVRAAPRRFVRLTTNRMGGGNGRNSYFPRSSRQRARRHRSALPASTPTLAQRDCAAAPLPDQNGPLGSRRRALEIAIKSLCRLAHDALGRERQSIFLAVVERGRSDVDHLDLIAKIPQKPSPVGDGGFDLGIGPADDP